MLRKPWTMLLAISESLLSDSSDEPTIHDQTGSGIGMKCIDTEND